VAGPHDTDVAPFRHELRVRYHECDAQGIVFNANWFTYFDIVNAELWRATLGSYAALTATGIDVVVAEARARFHASARFDELLAFEARVTRLGTTSMTFALRALREGRLLVEGELRYVAVDPRTMGKAPIPGAVRAVLGPFTLPG
jgi:acyl-CoA thioester hydrolase